jgi:hypothetical protein
MIDARTMPQAGHRCSNLRHNFYLFMAVQEGLLPPALEDANSLPNLSRNIRLEAVDKVNESP